MDAGRRRHFTGRVLSTTNPASFPDVFDMGKKLGSGQFGTTYVCVERATGQAYACKCIPKSKLLTEGDVEDVRREVAILYHVQNQPNIVNIKDAYEDKDHVYIVMELCAGGELYDTIIKRIEARGVPYSEKDAAEMAKVIVRVVECCHSLGVVHRDLKPENFLLSSRDEATAELKATDFGLSCFYKGEGMSRHCGSPMYMAPEVIKWRPGAFLMAKRPPKYGPEVDVWSAGVIIYALLCGFPPFYHRSHSTKEIFKAVLRGKPTFAIAPWPSISDHAKELVNSMLNPDPSKRPTAHQVLCECMPSLGHVIRGAFASGGSVLTAWAFHLPPLPLPPPRLWLILPPTHLTDHPWLSDGMSYTETSREFLRRYWTSPAITQRHHHVLVSSPPPHYRPLQVIAESLREEEIRGLREMFQVMDTDRSGTITVEELRAGLRKFGAQLSDLEINKLMEETDIDQSGEIEYGEFLAATMHLSKLDQQEHLLRAFEFFDRDGSGSITLDELQKACEELKMSRKEIESMMREVDENNDGTIDYNEFVAMMRETQMQGLSRRDILNGHAGLTDVEMNSQSFRQLMSID
ncbi:unnamed protein product [Closterium sp. NIES-53]